MSASQAPSIDANWYRQVLGQYPTGVCVVTADVPDAGPNGMVVGSFSSVSIDPPLIAFYPAKSSTSWPKIEAAGSFCVNILGADQEHICRTMSSKAVDKFENVAFHRAPLTGSPIIDEDVGWIDCDIEQVLDAGDHVLVLGRVRQLELESPRLPLLFFQGGYGRFSPLSLAASDTSGSLTIPLRHVDLIRPHMEKLARTLDCRCLAGTLMGEEVILVASAGHSQEVIDTTTLVGQHVPFLPPSGAVFAAWAREDAREHWLQQGLRSAQDQHRAALDIVRQRGYSLGLLSPAQRKFASTLEAMALLPSTDESPSLLGLIPRLSYDPPELTVEILSLVRQISAPVYDADGHVALALTIFGFGAPTGGTAPLLSALLDTTAAATARIGGRRPTAP